MDTHTSAPVRVASRRLSFDTAAVWALSLTGALAVIAFIPTSSVSFIYTKVFILTLGAIVSLALYILARLSRGNIILPPLLFIGALWLVLTLAFEFGLGHALGRSWAALLADYDLTRGGLLSIGMVVLALAPWIAAHFRDANFD